MPVASVRGAQIQYEILGTGDQWISFTPGGRAGMKGVRPLAERVADAGYRVLLHDRRNCGASDVIIDGDLSEQEIWADDLAELLGQLGASPVIVGGSSAGCRLSLLLTVRHPDAVRGQLLWWVTGGRFAAERLGQNYYGQFIDAANAGGMTAVCDSDFFSERIEENAGNRDRLRAMDPQRFIEVMSGWREFFMAGADLPVIGASEQQLRGITVPTCIVPGNDQTHPQHVGETLDGLLPDSELHYLPGIDEPQPEPTTDPAELLARQTKRQSLLAEIFIPFLAKRFPL